MPTNIGPSKHILNERSFILSYIEHWRSKTLSQSNTDLLCVFFTVQRCLRVALSIWMKTTQFNFKINQVVTSWKRIPLIRNCFFGNGVISDSLLPNSLKEATNLVEIHQRPKQCGFSARFQWLLKCEFASKYLEPRTINNGSVEKILEKQPSQNFASIAVVLNLIALNVSLNYSSFKSVLLALCSTTFAYVVLRESCGIWLMSG